MQALCEVIQLLLGSMQAILCLHNFGQCQARRGISIALSVRGPAHALVRSCVEGKYYPEAQYSHRQSMLTHIFHGRSGSRPAHGLYVPTDLQGIQGKPLVPRCLLPLGEVCLHGAFFAILLLQLCIN